jgi:hypothetical protein
MYLATHGDTLLMPGRPKLTAFSKHVEENGGDEWVFGYVAEGLSMKKVAAKVGASSRGLLYSWIDAGGEARKKALKVARAISAHSIAEDAGEILDELADSLTPVTSADVSLASSRAKYRQWMAGMRNRDEYGDQSGVQINVSVGDMHLDALRRNGAAQIPVIEAEVIEEEEATHTLPPGDEDATDTLPEELQELM